MTITYKPTLPDDIRLRKTLSTFKLFFPDDFFSAWSLFAIILRKIRILEKKILNVRPISQHCINGCISHSTATGW